MSLRALAGEVYVSAGHLSRIVRCADGKRPTLTLLRRITDVLELPPGYFIETRRARVRELVALDDGLVDRLYDEVDVPLSE